MIGTLNIINKKFNLIKFVFIFLLLISFCFIKPVYSKDFNYYEDLAKDWIKIFPDQNRNAAGPKFFKHILDKKIFNELKFFIYYVMCSYHIISV